MRKKNNIFVQVLDINGNVILDFLGMTTRFSNLRYGTIYPGGLYSTLSVRFPRNVRDVLPYHLWKRIKVYSNHALVWEGYISDISETREGSIFYTQVDAIGSWGTIMEIYTYEKWWADTRITDDLWTFAPGTSGANKVLVDRHSRLRFTPKAEAWANGEFGQLAYTSPTGQTVKRITHDFDFQEAAQAWEIQTHDGTAAIWSQITSGTGSRDDTLGTPVQIVRLRYYSRSASPQTPTSDGTYYGEISNVVVYSETGNINIYEIVIDLLGLVSGSISTDIWELDSGLTYSLVPFLTGGQETLASIIRRAAAFGNASQKAVGYFLDSSERSSNGRPLMVLETQPVLTGTADYALSLSETPGAGIRLNYDGVKNWITVEWENELGNIARANPNDDATLKDQDSIDKYGTRPYVLSVRNATQTIAINAGRRFLAQYKEPTYAVTSPLQATGTIKGGAGNDIPASFVRAGKTLQINDYIDGKTGKPLQLLVTATEYDHDAQTVRITLGIPDDFAVFLEQAKA